MSVNNTISWQTSEGINVSSPYKLQIISLNSDADSRSVFDNDRRGNTDRSLKLRRLADDRRLFHMLDVLKKDILFRDGE